MPRRWLSNNADVNSQYMPAQPTLDKFITVSREKKHCNSEYISSRVRPLLTLPSSSFSFTPVASKKFFWVAIYLLLTVMLFSVIFHCICNRLKYPPSYSYIEWIAISLLQHMSQLTYVYLQKYHRGSTPVTAHIYISPPRIFLPQTLLDRFLADFSLVLLHLCRGLSSGFLPVLSPR